MSVTRRQMKLGVSMIGLGYHMAAWRHPDVDPAGNMKLSHYAEVTRIAERGKFDLVFLADGVGIRAQDEPKGALARSSKNVVFEPLTLLSALAMTSERVGLVATASTTYNEPYHVARKFASLDHISGGRAGWNVVSSFTDTEARNFGFAKAPDYDKRYDRAAEFVEVVRGLWESWEDDAFIRDKTSGVNYDESKLHVLNHKGAHFTVAGPLNVARTPQGHPVIFQAGASDQGRELAAATADALYAASQELDAAQAYYRDVKGRMARYGREPEHLKILPGILAVPGRTRQEAQDKHEQLQQLLDPLLGLNQLSRVMGDLSAYDVDGPVPDAIDPRMRSRAQIFLDLAKRDNLTIRQLYTLVAAGNGHRTVVGTPADIADAMQDWFERDAADGYNILPPWLPGGLADVVEMVVPELQRRGLFRTEYEGRTLRENLGVPWPTHRRAALARAAAQAAD
ncbi:MAG TPA: LLM class flavin-dependent oxidoreductase [Falsiroseomonas sp.]|jgi:alkanesulfonate monooxygenase|nr:LLM class flavin-dependent oxidoreductase [Falsiroseomonas sp.]